MPVFHDYCRTNRVSTIKGNRFVKNSSQGFGGAIKVPSSSVTRPLMCLHSQRQKRDTLCPLHTPWLTVLAMVWACCHEGPFGRYVLTQCEHAGMQIGSPDGGCKPVIASNLFQQNKAKLTVGRRPL